MKKIAVVYLFILGICLFMSDGTVAGSLPSKSTKLVYRKGNLLFNGSFNHTNHPLEGWNYDYSWDGNKNYASNHKAIKVLKSHKSHQSVCSIGPRYWTKIDSKPIKYEQGKRLICKMDISGGSATRIFFNGWKWKPGVRPNADPKLGELRMSYKSKPILGGGGGGWKKITFSVPGFNQQSDLAMKSLRYVRWVTVHCITKGTLYIDNVTVTEGVWQGARTYTPKTYKKTGTEKKLPSFMKKPTLRK